MQRTLASSPGEGTGEETRLQIFVSFFSRGLPRRYTFACTPRPFPHCRRGIMARNEEKAQFMLNRYLASKAEEHDGANKKPRRRPHLAAECSDLYEAETWRNQILREIGSKVMDIQNEGLGEERIRQLNDEINKLMRVKYHWEKRILELGGPDHTKSSLKIAGENTEEGRKLPAGSYRYYGAAKHLPGVKELFEVRASKKKKQTKGELMKKIDGDYYGFRDEDDGGEMVAREAEAEGKLRERKLREQREAWDASNVEENEGSAYEVHGAEFQAYVPLPSAELIEAKLLETKKQKLLAAYGNAADN